MTKRRLPSDEYIKLLRRQRPERLRIEKNALVAGKPKRELRAALTKPSTLNDTTQPK